MAIKFIDILEPVNPAASAIAKSKQIAGARSVETRDDLDTIIPQVLSASYNPADGSHENDAIGQVWYVANENKYYKLTDFSVNTNASPFTINRTWELFIDSTITASAITNRITNIIKNGFETQTIFGYNSNTGSPILGNAIYIGGYYENDNDYEGVMIASRGQTFNFPSNDSGILATQNYVNNIESNINNNIQDIIDSNISSLQSEIDNSVVKFKNVDAEVESSVISNESVSTGTTDTVVSGNITQLQTLLSKYDNYNTIKLKSIKHIAGADITTNDVSIADVEFCNGTEKYGSNLPVGWISYADTGQIGPTMNVGDSSTRVYKYVGETGGYITTTSNWINAILEADITCVGKAEGGYHFMYDYIDTADQIVEFSFTVSNTSSKTQNIFYITTANVENSQAYSLAIGNSYASDAYVAIGYTNSEIGINSNPKDYASFQEPSSATGSWTLLTKYADSLVDETSSVDVAGTLNYHVTIGKGKLKCTVYNVDTNQTKEFDEIDIPNFKFRYFGFMNDGVADASKIYSISATVKQVPLYLHVSYTTQQNSNETYLGHSTNYVTVDAVSSELVWNFDNLSIPVEATTLYTRFASTTNNVTTIRNTASFKLLTYTVSTTSGFGYYGNRLPFIEVNDATVAAEFEMSIYDSNNIDINQSLFAGPDDRNILLSAEDYVKFDRPIASSLIRPVDGNKIGGNISIPFIDGNDTFALVSDIDLVDLQTVLDNQGAKKVVLNSILTIVKTPVENVHPLLMFGDFSSRIGSVYYPDPDQAGLITGFINNTFQNTDGSFTVTNAITGSPLTLIDGTDDNHAASVGQVNKMISSAISEMDDRNVKKYTISNPEISVVDGIATWQNVVKFKNSDDVTGIDFGNAPVVHVYNKTNGMTVYPDIELKAISEDSENYTSVNIIFKSKSNLVNDNEYVAIIMTTAKKI